MDSEVIRERILRALREEVRKHRGAISRLDRELGRSDGYLSKACQGKWSLSLDVLLQTLEALEVDPAFFFARALDIVPEPAVFLSELAVDAAPDRALRRLEEATRKLEKQPPPAPEEPSRADPGTLVADLAACGRREQRRRLRSTRKYRCAAVARAYLEHLDALRYDDPEEAAKLAETVAVDLIPSLGCAPAVRLDLQCLTIGVFGSCRRLQASYGAASRALRIGLELTRRHHRTLATADLLERSAALLSDHTQHRRALICLREAQQIYSDHKQPALAGRTLVSRGNMLLHLGDRSEALTAFESSLDALGDDPAQERGRLAATVGIAMTYRDLKRPERAREWLDKAIALAGAVGEIDAARVIWLKGSMALEAGDFEEAQELLHRARESLGSNPLQAALVALDEASTWVALDRSDEVRKLSKEMLCLLKPCRHSSALVELIRQGLEGRMSQALIRRAGKELRRGLDEHTRPAAFSLLESSVSLPVR